VFSNLLSITLPNIGKYFSGIHFPRIHFPKKNYFPANKRGPRHESLSRGFELSGTMWLEDLKIRRLLSSFNHKKKRGQKRRK